MYIVYMYIICTCAYPDSSVLLRRRQPGPAAAGLQGLSRGCTEGLFPQSVSTSFCLTGLEEGVLKRAILATLFMGVRPVHKARFARARTQNFGLLFTTFRPESLEWTPVDFHNAVDGDLHFPRES